MGKPTNNVKSYTDFFYRIFRNILLFSFPFTVISTLVLSLPHSSADSSSDTIKLSVPVSCTLSSRINTGEEHTISMVAGTYKDNIGKTTLTTYCNDKDGYVIYAIGATNNIEGKNTLSSIDLGEDYDIATGLNTSKPVSGEDVSNWAMKLIPVAGNYTPIIPASYNNAYGLVPSTWTNVAHRDPGTFDMSEGSTFTTTYAVYAKGTQPASTYTGQVKYALLHPSSSISPTTLERAFFLAGKTKVDIVDPTTGETNSYYKMQDMTTSICNTANITGEASQVQLVDIRDNKTYWVTKLLDGHCWMTQNLDLDLIANHNYTHSDTDLGWDPNSFDANVTWTLTGGPSAIPWNITTGKFTGWIDNNNSPYSADPGEKYYYTSNSTASDIVYDSLIDCTNAGHMDCKHYHAGNYYNWTAAIASNNSSSITSGNALNSICPAGWKLPKFSLAEFANLLVIYNVISDISSVTYANNGLNIIRDAPLYFVRSGIVDSGSLINSAGRGSYLYNTLSSGSIAFNFSFSSGGIDFKNEATRGRYGFPLRCLAR